MLNSSITVLRVLLSLFSDTNGSHISLMHLGDNEESIVVGTTEELTILDGEKTTEETTILDGEEITQSGLST